MDGLSILPGVNGSISPKLQYEKVKPASIGNEALGLFGILLLANQSNGDPAFKHSTAITPDHDVSITISPEVFHSLIFCPAVASTLGSDISSLPGSCGGVGAIGHMI